jgi:hypothetical protein
MSSPKFRIACCLCRKPIPLAEDVYALDAEWQRRFPQMVGALACQKCALSTSWQCHAVGGGYVEGHIRVPDQPESSDYDSWSHLREHGTHIGMVMHDPQSGLLQGAEEYIRYTAGRRGADPEVAGRLRAVLQTWDARS